MKRKKHSGITSPIRLAQIAWQRYNGTLSLREEKPVNPEQTILQQYAQLLRTYVEMRQQMVDLLRTMDEEESPQGSGAARTAADLLDMAYEFMDETREHLEPVDKLLMAVQPLFFAHSMLLEGSEEEPNMDDLRDLLKGLNLDL